MTNHLTSATHALLHRGDIVQRDVDALLGRLTGAGIDTGELFFQHCEHESWSLEDGTVKSGAYGVDRGVGVRAISGEKTGFAYAEDIALPALRNAAEAARAITRSGESGTALHSRGASPSRSPALTRDRPPARYGDANPIASTDDSSKVALLRRIDAFARGLDPAVREVTVRISLNHDTSLVVATDGTMGADVRPLARFDVMVIAERNGRRERGFAGGGGRFDTGWLFDTNAAQDYAREAVRTALVNLDGVDAPAGAMPVVLGPGWPGVLLHEAVGHGLEGDFNRKGTSAFAGRMGETVASELCTVVDDATLADRRGSLTVDDEGTPGQRTVLIENGVLVGYMQDKHNARLMGSRSTGNARRQSYAHPPMPRMTNTFLLPGSSEPEEIIASVDKGVYAASFGGGQVDITSGKFTFSATEAYLIEGGKLGPPIRGATLMGNGPEVMGRVSMVGNDLKLDTGVGICGKDGQSVPVGVGQPSLRIDQITVGGTHAS